MDDVNVFALLDFALFDDAVLQLLDLTLVGRQIVWGEVEALAQGLFAVVEDFEHAVSDVLCLPVVREVEHLDEEQRNVHEAVGVVHLVGGVQLRHLLTVVLVGSTAVEVVLFPPQIAVEVGFLIHGLEVPFARFDVAIC